MPPTTSKKPRAPRKTVAAVTTQKRKNASEAGSDSEEYTEEWDSEALDDDAPKKRKLKKKLPKKKAKRRKNEEESEEEGEEEGEEEELKEGQTVVGKVVKPPKEGWASFGLISHNTLDFLKNLAKPECNDREWFKLHEPTYRLAEKEWKFFIEAFTPLLIEVDPHIPELPPKDVQHRIYRDVRFSNNKTPYKQGFSASFSRSGRKGIFAHYHIAIIPNNRSLVAAGAWQPGKNELATMRHHILHDPSRLRNIISDPEFVKYFGEAKPHPKGERRNIFGQEDELKVAPKGVDKGHRDIDLLKLRSIAVVHYFLDSEVVAPDFISNVCKVIKIMKPLVHCLNDMMTIPVEDDDSSDDAEEDES